MRRPTATTVAAGRSSIDSRAFSLCRPSSDFVCYVESRSVSRSWRWCCAMLSASSRTPRKFRACSRGDDSLTPDTACLHRRCTYQREQQSQRSPWWSVVRVCVLGGCDALSCHRRALIATRPTVASRARARRSASSRRETCIEIRPKSPPSRSDSLHRQGRTSHTYTRQHAHDGRADDNSSTLTTRRV